MPRPHLKTSLCPWPLDIIVFTVNMFSWSLTIASLCGRLHPGPNLLSLITTQIQLHKQKKTYTKYSSQTLVDRGVLDLPCQAQWTNEIVPKVQALHVRQFESSAPF